MSNIKINSARQNRTVHKARIEEKDLLALARQAVADQLGIDLELNGGTVETSAYVSSYQEGSLGDRRTCIEVELIQRHDPMASPEAA